MRLIDADAVLKELKKSCEYHAENSRELSLLQRDIIIVQEQPTVDAVPVIRCRECKWYGRVDKRRFYRGADCLQNRISTIVPDEDYCSRAERRTDETD